LLDAISRSGREARALYLGGAGRAFCSGANLAEGGMDISNPDRDAGARLEAIFNPMILALRDLDVPLVVGVRGAAAGVGCAIALAGDIIIAGRGAYFYQAFCHVGLVPDGGSSYLLARSVGRVRAMEMMLLGERIPAESALNWGLITRVVADDAIEDAALAVAKRLAAGPSSLRLIRKAAWAALDASLDEERALQREAGRTADFTEGVRAFREKRRPSFKGQ
jgi:2-(1,2-epoxy-1,2-dihydrophenyl)acetyl-CoA isomerase